MSYNLTSLSGEIRRKMLVRHGVKGIKREISTYSVCHYRHPPYYRDTIAVVNDGAYDAGDVSFPPVDAHPRIPCVLCDLQTNEREDVTSMATVLILVRSIRIFNVSFTDKKKKNTSL